MTDDPFTTDIDPDQLATFIQEYVRRENEPDAGPRAVIAAQLRDPRYLPHHVAEMLLSKPEIQASIAVIRKTYKAADVKEVSIATLTADMEVIYQEAKMARQFTAAIAAKKMQAEMAGYLNKDINVNVRHSIATMTDGDLEKIARKQVVEGEFTDVSPITGLPVVVDDQPRA